MLFLTLCIHIHLYYSIIIYFRYLPTCNPSVQNIFRNMCTRMRVYTHVCIFCVHVYMYRH